MRQGIKLFICLTVLCHTWSSFAQKIDLGEPENQSIQTKAAQAFISFRSNGTGMGFQREKIISPHLNKGWRFEGGYSRQSKERKIHSSYGDAQKGFVYGKLNHVWHLRADYGFTRIINTKPYWGGISTAYYLYGGFVTGFTWPVYLKTWYMDENNQFQIVSEAYDPQRHSLANIYDGDAILKGFSEMKIHPGLHLQSGLYFDFGNKDKYIMALSFGLSGELYMIPIEYMAGQKPDYYLLNIYLNLHIGKRFSH